MPPQEIKVYNWQEMVLWGMINIQSVSIFVNIPCIKLGFAIGGQLNPVCLANVQVWIFQAGTIQMNIAYLGIQEPLATTGDSLKWAPLIQGQMREAGYETTLSQYTATVVDMEKLQHRSGGGRKNTA